MIRKTIILAFILLSTVLADYNNDAYEDDLQYELYSIEETTVSDDLNVSSNFDNVMEDDSYQDYENNDVDTGVVDEEQYQYSENEEYEGGY